MFARKAFDPTILLNINGNEIVIYFYLHAVSLYLQLRRQILRREDHDIISSFRRKFIHSPQTSKHHINRHRFQREDPSIRWTDHACGHSDWGLYAAVYELRVIEV